MNKRIDKIIIEKAVISKFYYGILVYLFVGAVLLANSRVGEEYIDIMSSLITSKLYLCLFIFPSCILLSTNMYTYINRNNYLILRLEDRTQYIKLLLRTTLKLTIIIIIMIFFIVIIATNLTEHTNFNIHKTNILNSNNLNILIFSFFKITLSILTMQLLNCLLFTRLKKREYIVLILFFIIFFIFISTKFEVYKFGFLLPSAHIYSNILYRNLLQSIIYSIIYYLTLNSIFIFLLFKNKKDIDI